MDEKELFLKTMENMASCPEDINDKTYVGTVTSVLGTRKYLIRYNDADRVFRAKYITFLSVGDIVHIVYPIGSSKNSYMLEDIIAGTYMKLIKNG